MDFSIENFIKLIIKFPLVLISHKYVKSRDTYVIGFLWIFYFLKIEIGRLIQ